jgi:hypothetical protein
MRSLALSFSVVICLVSGGGQVSAQETVSPSLIQSQKPADALGRLTESPDRARLSRAVQMAAQCLPEGEGACDGTQCPGEDGGCQADCCAGTICTGVSMRGGTGGYVCLDPADSEAAQNEVDVCGWYALGRCSTSEASAQKLADEIGQLVVHTDTVPGFKKGLYCVTSGPTTESNALFDQKTLKEAGIDDAYVEEGCK